MSLKHTQLGSDFNAPCKSACKAPFKGCSAQQLKGPAGMKCYLKSTPKILFSFARDNFFFFFHDCDQSTVRCAALSIFTLDAATRLGTRASPAPPIVSAVRELGSTLIYDDVGKSSKNTRQFLEVAATICCPARARACASACVTASGPVSHCEH